MRTVLAALWGVVLLAGACTLNEVLPTERGPALVVIPTPSGGTQQIDQTEVTRAQYARFLAEQPAPSAELPAACAFKTDHAPDAACLADPAVCAGASCDDHPQVCVDWCDAVAFCRWAGRRLCGAMGGGPASFDPPPRGELPDSQWWNACSSGGLYVYPYGNAYDRARCRGGLGNAPGATTVEVGSLSSCQPSGEYRGVYDLSGNAAEWEDACEDDRAEARCLVRGGAFRGDAL